MQTPPISVDEARRQQALLELHVLDTPSEERFDRITRIARRIFKTPIALVTLIDGDRQWFKSRLGLTVTETSRDISFCGHAILRPEAMVVPDAMKDARFLDNPLVTGSPEIRFYAGFPLAAPGGERLGTLCVIDRVPRELGPEDLAILKDLAALAEAELNNRDMTEAVARMREAVSAQDELLAMASHELRAPLTVIQMTLGMVVEGKTGVVSEEALEMVGTALSGSDRLLAMISDYLDIARIESGQIAIIPRPMRLSELAARAIQAMRPLARGNRLTLALGPAAGDDLVNADENRLLQVVINLLSNAMKFAPQGSEVTLSVVRQGARVRLSVADRGAGIPDEFKPRIFSKFAQAKGAKTGSGLGLMICKRLVEAQGGVIGFETAHGQGTTFYFELPALDD